MVPGAPGSPNQQPAEGYPQEYFIPGQITQAHLCAHCRKVPRQCVAVGSRIYCASCAAHVGQLSQAQSRTNIDMWILSLQCCCPCGWRGPCGELNAHVTVCPLMPWTCELCKTTFTNQEKITHLQTCPNVSIECRFHCTGLDGKPNVYSPTDEEEHARLYCRFRNLATKDELQTARTAIDADLQKFTQQHVAQNSALQKLQENFAAHQKHCEERAAALEGQVTTLKTKVEETREHLNGQLETIEEGLQGQLQEDQAEITKSFEDLKTKVQEDLAQMKTTIDTPSADIKQLEDRLRRLEGASIMPFDVTVVCEVLVGPSYQAVWQSPSSFFPLGDFEVHVRPAGRDAPWVPIQKTIPPAPTGLLCRCHLQPSPPGQMMEIRVLARTRCRTAERMSSIARWLPAPPQLPATPAPAVPAGLFRHPSFDKKHVLVAPSPGHEHPDPNREHLTPEMAALVTSPTSVRVATSENCSENDQLYIQITLSTLRLCPTHYSLCIMDPAIQPQGPHPAFWALEGSSDGLMWEHLHGVDNDDAFDRNKQGLWLVGNPSGKAYRHFRILSTGPNSEGQSNNALRLGGMEMFGCLLEDPSVPH